MAELGHRPGLDGLRGLAVAGVLIAHSEIHGPFAMAGGVGVTVFFALSGFLITALLLEEQDRGRISLRRFYERRARRLLPALPLVLALCALVNLWLGVAVWSNVAAAVFYSSNVTQLAGVDGGAFRHLWSLAIEEHFYLFWPLVVIAVPRRHLFRVAVIAAVVIAAVRMVGPWDGETLYRATPLRLDAMLAGCALAVAFHWGRMRTYPTWPAWVIVAGASLMMPMDDWMRWMAPAVALASVALICGQVTRPTLTHPALRRLGRISYGVYLFHYPVSLVARSRWDGWASFAVTVALTLALAELSYRVIESRWLRRSHALPVQVPDLSGRQATVPHREVRQVAGKF